MPIIIFDLRKTVIWVYPNIEIFLFFLVFFTLLLYHEIHKVNNLKFYAYDEYLFIFKSNSISMN